MQMSPNDHLLCSVHGLCFMLRLCESERERTHVSEPCKYPSQHFLSYEAQAVLAAALAPAVTATVLHTCPDTMRLAW